MAGRRSSSSSRSPSGSTGKSSSPGRVAGRSLRFLLTVGVLFALVHLTWIPLQPLFMRLLATATGWALRLMEHPSIVTGLTSSGNAVTIHSYVTGEPLPLTVLHCDPFHVTVVLSLALVMSVPLGSWRARLRACAITLGVVFIAMTAVCAVQIQLAAENYAMEHLGLTLYSHSEKRILDWAVRKTSLLTVYIIPAILFLFFHLEARTGGETNRIAPALRDAARGGATTPTGRAGWIPPASRPAIVTMALIAIAAGGLSLASLRSHPPDVVHIPGLRKIADLNPNSARAQFNLAVSLEKAGRLDEAIGPYRRTLRLAPEHVGAYLGAGNVYHGQGDFARAARSYEEVLKRDPDSTAALFNLGNSVLKAGSVDRAADLYAEVVRHDPDNAAGHLNLGKALARTGRRCDALPHLLRAAELDVRLRSEDLARSIRSLKTSCP